MSKKSCKNSVIFLFINCEWLGDKLSCSMENKRTWKPLYNVHVFSNLCAIHDTQSSVRVIGLSCTASELFYSQWAIQKEKHLKPFRFDRSEFGNIPINRFNEIFIRLFLTVYVLCKSIINFFWCVVITFYFVSSTCLGLFACGFSFFTQLYYHFSSNNGDNLNFKANSVLPKKTQLKWKRRKKLEGVSWVYVWCIYTSTKYDTTHCRNKVAKKLKIYGAVAAAADELIQSKANVVRLSKFAWYKDKQFC